MSDHIYIAAFNIYNYMNLTLLRVDEWERTADDNNNNNYNNFIISPANVNVPLTAVSRRCIATNRIIKNQCKVNQPAK